MKGECRRFWLAPKVRVYTTDYCGYCDRAKALLEKLSVPFEEIDVTDDPEARRRLVAATGLRTVPQIFLGEQSIGGFTDLLALVRSGEFARMYTA